MRTTDSPSFILPVRLTDESLASAYYHTRRVVPLQNLALVNKDGADLHAIVLSSDEIAPEVELDCLELSVLQQKIFIKAKNTTAILSVDLRELSNAEVVQMREMAASSKSLSIYLAPSNIEQEGASHERRTHPQN